MTNIILRGCNGKMGRTITQLVEEDQDVQIVAGIDLASNPELSYPVYQSFTQCSVDADVIIDFSAPINVREMLEYAEAKNIGIVLCTTGFNEEDIILIEEFTNKIALLRSANMSFGVNVLVKLVQEAAKHLAHTGFDIEVVERHHNKKVDAPSGTALLLADAMNEVLNQEYSYKYDRSMDRLSRPEKEIGISAVRGGTIVGEHEIIFAGTDEVIEIKHTAYSKAIFAKGAIQGAKYLHGKPKGLYQLQDLMGE